MNDSNHTKQKEIEKIEIKLEEILREKFYTGAEHFSQLSAIDLFYLYGEISVEFGVFLTIEDMDSNCFSSLHQLACVIQNAYNQGG
jgi:hypothetical protein